MKNIKMKVDTRVFGTRNVLSALGNAKIAWDEVGLRLVRAPEKIGENKLEFELCKEKMNVHVHKNRATSGRSRESFFQRRDVKSQRGYVLEDQASNVAMLRSNIMMF